MQHLVLGLRPPEDVVGAHGHTEFLHIKSVSNSAVANTSVINQHTFNTFD